MLIDFTVIRKLIYLQILVTGILSGLFGYSSGIEAAISSTLGGMICIIPGHLFVRIYFKGTLKDQATQIISRFYWGEGLKILISMLLFTASLQWSKLKPLPMFVVFIATQLVYWTVPWLASTRPKDQAKA